MSKKPKIIILGAGMSGIACALRLYKNFDVQIYEKSRGIGEGFAQKDCLTECFTLARNFAQLTQPLFKIF